MRIFKSLSNTGRVHDAALPLVFLIVTAGSAFAANDPKAPDSAQTIVEKDDPGETSLTPAELDRILAPLKTGTSFEERRAAAAAIMDLGPDAVNPLRQKLVGFREENSAVLGDALKASRDANVRRGTPYELLDALLHLQPSEVPGAATATTIVCIARALAHIGTTPALRGVVFLAGDHNGLFRPELTRLIKQSGERAVPALIEGRVMGARTWSGNQLEAIGKRLPGEAIQTKSNQVLSDVLRAFGAIHDMDALGVVLSFVNSDRAQVRVAARESLGRYGQDAIWKLREAYSNLLGKSATDTWTADQVAKELFGAYDRFRLQDVYALLDDGLAKYKDGKLDQAVGAFEKVLARQPMLDRRAEVIPAYREMAHRFEGSDNAKALTYLKIASHLGPEDADAKKIRAQIAYLEGIELERKGFPDEQLFRQALVSDPGHTGARHELDRLANGREGSSSRLKRWAAIGAVCILALIAIVLFGRLPPKRSSGINP